MRLSGIIFLTCLLLLSFNRLQATDMDSSTNIDVKLVLIPPSPVTNQITMDIRAGIYNNSSRSVKIDVAFYLDKEKEEERLFHNEISINNDKPGGVKFRWSTVNKQGMHTIIVVCRSGQKVFRTSRLLEIIPSFIRSTKKIDGAFMGFYHWSETEGKHWNKDIKTMTDSQWKELVDAQHRIGMDIIVMQETFRNQMYEGHHNIEKEGYKGKAYYPSDLFPDRMPITAHDPVEAVLSEADKKGMYVFVAVGLYAWFDFTPSSLAWHKKLASELFKKYHHHPSFYGWYISEEMDGGLGNAEQRKDIVQFFQSFSNYVHKISPEKPVMLATNSHNIHGAEATYERLLPALDILCPFGFHRMPKGDFTGEEAASILQNLCNKASSHLWMDLEVFDFTQDSSLVPRSIKGLVSDLTRFPNFEKIICYQFPGLLSSPEMSIHPGGENTIQLYLDYEKYLKTLATSSKK
ncbi:MAG: DUF4434 domain-containing protein [Flavisolibacter sp.]